MLGKLHSGLTALWAMIDVNESTTALDKVSLQRTQNTRWCIVDGNAFNRGQPPAGPAFSGDEYWVFANLVSVSPKSRHHGDEVTALH